MTLPKYNEDFQRELLATILCDPEKGISISSYKELIQAFDSDLYKAICEITFAFYYKFSSPPNSVQLSMELAKKDFKGIENTLIPLFIKPGSTEYYLNAAFEFIHFAKLQDAILRASSFLDLNDLPNAKSVINDVSKFTGVSFDVGLDYFEGQREVLEEAFVPTHIGPLDHFMKGGLYEQELGAILAPPGAGKSQFLVWVGVAAMHEELNVIHYTLEMSAKKVRARYDACLLDIAHRDTEGKLDQINKEVDLLKRRLGHSLYIKQYPTKAASVTTIRAHVKALDNIGFIPDLIVVDYADLLSSEKGHSDRRIEQGSAWEELRGLAIDLEIPIWTASQANRKAMDEITFGIEKVAESFEKAMIADTMIALCQTPDEKRRSMLRLYIAKNRNEESGVEIEIKYDFKKSKFCLDAVVV